jgi:hypothetical protein
MNRRIVHVPHLIPSCGNQLGSENVRGDGQRCKGRGLGTQSKVGTVRQEDKRQRLAWEKEEPEEDGGRKKRGTQKGGGPVASMASHQSFTDLNDQDSNAPQSLVFCHCVC